MAFNHGKLDDQIAILVDPNSTEKDFNAALKTTKDSIGKYFIYRRNFKARKGYLRTEFCKEDKKDKNPKDKDNDEGGFGGGFGNLLPV